MSNNTSLRSLANQMEIFDAKSQKSANINKNSSGNKIQQTKSLEMNKPKELTSKKIIEGESTLQAN